jgi:hypothetical protein
MEIPLAGWVSRPPTYRYNKQDALNHFGFYFSEPNKSLHFETLDDYRALFIQLLFKREMRRSLLNLGLEFQYNYCRKPEKIWGLTHQFFYLINGGSAHEIDYKKFDYNAILYIPVIFNRLCIRCAF